MSGLLASRAPTAAALGLAAVAMWAPPAAAQLHAGAGAIGILTRMDPAPGDVVRTEARVVQPVVTARWAFAGGHLSLLGTLNAEGGTVPNGELAQGNWGEGFVDRRHPHTWGHELLLEGTAGDRAWGLPLEASLSAGKGFVAYGTDDPMNRPAIRYPVNHHLAQALERAVIIGGLRLGPAALEGTLFNGDEPETPTQWPNWERFGDSWAVRLTLSPVRGLELQGSHASVASPEFRAGVGPDQRKWSASARWAGPLAGGAGYAMAEWAESDEVDGFFTFGSVLVEGEWRHDRHRPYARWEQTERPEEERISEFRSRRPHLDNAILGITEWTVWTAGYGFTAWRRGGLAVEPILEGSLASVASVEAGVFDPELWYGSDTIWSLTVGVALRWGSVARGHRMGRYGVLRALDATADPGHVYGPHGPASPH